MWIANLVLAIVASLFIGAIVSLIILALAKKSKENDPKEISRQQLAAILSTDGYEDYSEDDGPASKHNILAKWNRSWGKLLSELSGSFSENDPKGGVVAAVTWIAISAILALVFNPIAGPVLATALIVLVHFALKARAGKKDNLIREQLTGFLFGIKANVSANETPERALMKVIETMPSPLYDEVLPARNQILSNVGFTEAMTFLRDHTTSEDLRFLCSCMIQASSTGVSLENQIDTILDAVEQKRRITEEIKQATKTANISMNAAAIIIPGAFLGSYFLSPQVQEFWFIDPISWGMLAFAVLISFVGVRQARKYVAKVREL